MFEFLKKKVSSFTEKLKKTLEKKQEEKPPEQPKQETETPVQEPAPKKTFEKTRPVKTQTNEKTTEKKPEEKEVQKETISLEKVKKEKTKSQKKDYEEKRELKAKIGLTKKLKGIFSGTITVSEAEIKDFLEEFELSLLEADVEANAAQKITLKLKNSFLGKKISAKQNISEFLKQEIKKALLEIMETNEIDFLEQAKNKKPFVVLFLGPNGAGKTTSIAKTAQYLKKHGKTVVLCAADTFRAASIEQLQVHADALGVKIVKHGYGADPAAVAFDAIASAKAKNTDVVLIDSAGRQETNKNLVEELKKLERVAKPDLKVFVGESYAGQMLLSQAQEFNTAVKIDAFILTKIDVDSKGGTAISLLYSLKKPIIFVGTGQGYDNLEKFTPEFIVEKII